MNKLLIIFTIAILLVGTIGVYALEGDLLNDLEEGIGEKIEEINDQIKEEIKPIVEVFNRKVPIQDYNDIKAKAKTDEFNKYVYCKDSCSVHIVGGELDLTFEVEKGTKEEIDTRIDEYVKEYSKETTQEKETELRFDEVIKYEK